MKKYLVPTIILLVSAVLLVTSLYYNSSKETKKTSVKGIKDTNISYIPLNASIISSDYSEEGETKVYTTSLSQDQVHEFYTRLANLNGWKEENKNKFFIKENTLEIRVEKEAGEKSLVTLKMTNRLTNL